MVASKKQNKTKTITNVHFDYGLSSRQCVLSKWWLFSHLMHHQVWNSCWFLIWWLS